MHHVTAANYERNVRSKTTGSLYDAFTITLLETNSRLTTCLPDRQAHDSRPGRLCAWADSTRVK